MRLFVAGSTARSLRTVQDLRLLLKRELGEAGDLEVVDIYQQPELAKRDHVVAAPTLIRLSPAPVRRVVGNLSDERRVLRALILCEDEEMTDEG
ncbi:circadian clock protein KaiB [Roseomonas marmotae]|uniref:Circadian clock protein KaiB n=1 Tax=Roseomonas marmotae TaxID=2768161 RepID=A0ABS3KGP4_9PROT|nr:circadian clock KaiB family protein [Roseomonas marmotae]MBO1076646.1 circadian clock protein KaiB [Roseomonas marmotae]QTI80777.1 circadian clock protein KaiB [Roseomonas marmotae]